MWHQPAALKSIQTIHYKLCVCVMWENVWVQGSSESLAGNLIDLGILYISKHNGLDNEARIQRGKADAFSTW